MEGNRGGQPTSALSAANGLLEAISLWVFVPGWNFDEGHEALVD